MPVVNEDKEAKRLHSMPRVSAEEQVSICEGNHIMRTGMGALKRNFLKRGVHAELHRRSGLPEAKRQR